MPRRYPDKVAVTIQQRILAGMRKHEHVAQASIRCHLSARAALVANIATQLISVFRFVSRDSSEYEGFLYFFINLKSFRSTRRSSLDLTRQPCPL
jgi:hypothetical protein